LASLLRFGTALDSIVIVATKAIADASVSTSVALQHPPRNGSYYPVLSVIFRRELDPLLMRALCDLRERESNNPLVPLLFRTYCCCPSSLSNRVGCWSSEYLMSAPMATYADHRIVAWYVVHTIPDRSALTAILLKTRRHK
jgi:hypothetical protein